MQTVELDDLIKEAVYNAPYPLCLDNLMAACDGVGQTKIVIRAMALTDMGTINTMVEDGITYFIP